MSEQPARGKTRPPAAGRVARILCATALIAGLMACQHTPFSEAFRNNHHLDASELQRIQFYTSSDIVLRRSLSQQKRGVEAGSFDIQSAVEVDEVHIAAGTPCVAVAVYREYIGVAFSPDTPKHLLWFSTVDSPLPGHYALTHITAFTAASPPAPRYSKGYAVRYGEHDYRVVEPADWRVYLMFDEEVSLNHFRRTQHPPGWRLSEGARSTATD